MSPLRERGEVKVTLSAMDLYNILDNWEDPMWLGAEFRVRFVDLVESFERAKELQEIQAHLKKLEGKL